MVGLLALGAPKVDGPTVEPTPIYMTEPVDTLAVDAVSNDSAARLEQEFDAG
jgi:hypothetical protein